MTPRTPRPAAPPRPAPHPVTRTSAVPRPHPAAARVPLATGPWTADDAAHLARRAGFGATPEELDELVALGREAAVARFVDFPDVDEELLGEIELIGGDLLSIESGEDWKGPESVYEVCDHVRRWWLHRMVHGRHPLREKLTLLWHDHFACQQSKIIRQQQYLRQNKTFRAHAAGSFRDLLVAVSEDPGMLTYLDNRLNETANPNENWGRELLELFTLGVDNGYVQQDVWELSRVFTGWTTPDVNTAEFVFTPERHDPTDKVVLGATIAGREGAAGLEEGYEALERILARRSCARFVARKLLEWFVTPTPPEEQVARFGDVLYESGYSLRETLRALFLSEWFAAPAHRLAQYRNPVDLAVSAARLLGLQNSYLFPLHEHTRLMGMNLFEPPSVAGWEHGKAWVNSASTVHRSNFALELSGLPHTARTVSGRTAIDLDALVGVERGAPDADAELPHGELVDRVADRLLQRPLPSRDVVVGCLDDADGWLDADLSPRARRREKTRLAVHLILTTPEFALA